MGFDSSWDLFLFSSCPIKFRYSLHFLGTTRRYFFLFFCNDTHTVSVSIELRDFSGSQFYLIWFFFKFIISEQFWKLYWVLLLLERGLFFLLFILYIAIWMSWFQLMGLLHLAQPTVKKCLIIALFSFLFFWSIIFGDFGETIIISIYLSLWSVTSFCSSLLLLLFLQILFNLDTFIHNVGRNNIFGGPTVTGRRSLNKIKIMKKFPVHK